MEHFVNTYHGKVQVSKPFAVIEFRDGFRNGVASEHATEASARSAASSAKASKRSDGYRATTWDYRAERTTVPVEETPHQRWARQRAEHAAAHPTHRTSRDATMGGHEYCSSSQSGGGCGVYITR